MECIPTGGLGWALLSLFEASPKEMAAPRRAAASSAEEGGAWGFSVVMVLRLLVVGLLREEVERLCISYHIPKFAHERKTMKFGWSQVLEARPRLLLPISESQSCQIFDLGRFPDENRVISSKILSFFAFQMSSHRDNKVNAC